MQQLEMVHTDLHEFIPLFVTNVMLHQHTVIISLHYHLTIEGNILFITITN